MNPQLLDKPARQPTEEKLVTLYGISWEKFKAIEAQLEDNRDVRFSYLSGVELSTDESYTSLRKSLKFGSGSLSN